MTNLRFDETRVLAQILDTTDPWQVAGQVRIDFPRFVRALRRLDRKGLVTTSKGRIALTPRGRRAARDLGLHPQSIIASRIRKARREFLTLARRRPSSISLYDQGHMDVDSVFRRVELIASLGDSDSRRVAVLGDDDLVSIALCLATQPEHVTVFEADQRIVDFITDVAVMRSLPITTEMLDLREPFPSRFRGRFHTFVTDPSETFPGLKMFVGTGLYLLMRGEGRAGYFGLTSIEASYQKWNRLERWLLGRYALSITHILPRNACYSNWSDLLDQTACFSMECLRSMPRTNWFNSSLVRLETIIGFKPKDLGEVRGYIFNDSEACGRIEGEVR
jgi:predicted methyltransferase